MGSQAKSSPDPGAPRDTHLQRRGLHPSDPPVAKRRRNERAKHDEPDISRVQPGDRKPLRQMSPLGVRDAWIGDPSQVDDRSDATHVADVADVHECDGRSIRFGQRIVDDVAEERSAEVTARPRLPRADQLDR